MTEEINPYRWAKENLSPARARAFEKAYRELERSKFSEEYRQEYKKEEQIRIAFIRSTLEKTEKIEAKAYQEADELEKQGHELLRKAQNLRNEAFEEKARIQSGVYDTKEHKEQRAKTSALWHRDHEAFLPKVQALMEKYLRAQTA